jgi:chaperone BCS1
MIIELSTTAFMDKLLANDIVTGLGAATVLGSVLYQLRAMPGRIYGWIMRTCTVTLSVRSSDSAFTWVEAWLAKQPYAQTTRRVQLSTNDNFWSEYEGPQWMLAPGQGVHFFWWRRRPVFINRTIESTPQGGKQTETIEFTTLGRSQDVLRAMVGEAREAIVVREQVSIRLWRGYWMGIRGKDPRKLDTIVLQPGQIERILADLKWYLTSKDWYTSRGLPYRRGYLFDGLPGTGKTSLVLAIAGHLKLPVCLLNLGSIQSDDSLMSAIIDAPPNAIVVIEDIDCADASATRQPKLVEPRRDVPAIDGNCTSSEKSADPTGVSKAGLLNALDGIATPDGRIFIMTTNHPEKLDPALIRPGRADVRETFTYLGPAEQCQLAEKFYAPGEFEPVGHPVSPALLQSVFMRCPTDPAMARLLLNEKPVEIEEKAA